MTSTPSFQVTVTDPSYDLSVWIVPMCTSIYDLKKENLWNGGHQSYSPDLFILGHNGKILHDDTTLAELATSGAQLDLDIFSFDVVLRNLVTFCDNKLTLIVKDSRQTRNIVQGFLIASKVTNADKVTLFGNKRGFDDKRVEIDPDSYNESFRPGQIIHYFCS